MTRELENSIQGLEVGDELEDVQLYLNCIKLCGNGHFHNNRILKYVTLQT